MYQPTFGEEMNESGRAMAGRRVDRANKKEVNIIPLLLEDEYKLRITRDYVHPL